MGLIVSVLRTPGTDCSNGGVSATFDSMLVTNVDGPFDRHDLPRVKLVQGNLAGTAKIVTETDQMSGRHTMFGGNMAYSSDSRWSRAVEEICGSRQSGAVAIHDRIEA